MASVAAWTCALCAGKGREMTVMVWEVMETHWEVEESHEEGGSDGPRARS